MSQDPWAAAAAPQAQQQTAEQGTQDDGLAGAYAAAPVVDEDLLFGQGASAPSLFNKTHFLGTERTGVITGTETKQDLDFNTRQPKYWSESRTGGASGNSAVTTDPVDAKTGRPNRKVLSTHVALTTSYRQTSQEWAAIGRDPAGFQDGQDSGERVFVASGQGLKAMRDAIGKYNQLNATSKITGPADLIGKTLVVKRSGQKPNPGGNPSWVLDITLR